MALGSYPKLTLKAARKARDAAKLQKSEGADPVKLRKLEKLKATRPDGDTFRAVALEWYGKQSPPMERQPRRTIIAAIGARLVSVDW